MAELQTRHEPNTTEMPRTLPPQAQASTVYSYPSAGIAEREGSVPVWLWIVVVSLLGWGFYYLVTYWNAPITPT